MKSRRLKLECLDAELRQIEAALDEGRDRKGAVHLPQSLAPPSGDSNSHCLQSLIIFKADICVCFHRV